MRLGFGIFWITLCLGLLFAGCSPKREVSGQVFVVTKGGESVKLGLVGVHVVGSRELVELASKAQRFSATNRANRKLLSELTNDLARLAAITPNGFGSKIEKIQQTVLTRIINESAEKSLEDLFFRMMPPAVTQTDADGVFVVQASGTDWLAARGQRQVGDSTESYSWLIPLSGVNTKLLVSNDRVLESEDDLLRALGAIAPTEAGIGAEPSISAWVAEQRLVSQGALAEAQVAETKALAEAKLKAQEEERERQRLVAKVENDRQQRQRLEAEAKAAEDLAKAKANAEATAISPQFRSILETLTAEKDVGKLKDFLHQLEASTGDTNPERKHIQKILREKVASLISQREGK